MSIYTQKRTCERCKALDGTAKSYENSCQLGFNNRGPVGAFGLIQTIPQEPCPKPLTIDAFYRELKRKHERQVEALLERRGTMTKPGNIENDRRNPISS